VVGADVLAFVRGALPAPPAGVLDVGAGRGELAAELRDAGYDVRAIDPAAEDGSGVERVELLGAEGIFDAAVAIVSLHHIEPLEESCAHLATLVRPGGVLVIDEFDVARLDERAAGWWLGQRRAVGAAEHHDEHEHHHAAGLVAAMREHIHPLRAVREALLPYFTLGEPVPGPYLHRWELGPGLRDAEEHLIAAGKLPATGARLVGRRRG
jgi:SAM-dependent methyltransferase